MKVIKVNAMGDTCPIPVIKTKNAIKEMHGAGVVEILVDNEIAVQNLTKMAKQKQYACQSEKIADQEYRVQMTIPREDAARSGETASAGEQSGVNGSETENAVSPEEISCMPDSRKKKKIVVLRSGKMGEGNDELGAVLMKGFIYALTELEELPETILLYNGGAPLSCEGSDSLEDLKTLEAQGVEIMTCGTCLNYYGLTDKLAVGTVTNMYAIAEKMSEADTIICP